MATTDCTPLSKDTRPTNLTLATLHRELNNYAMGIPSERGGGNHSHLALVINNASYITLANVAFINPVHPGPNPQPGATQPQITENNRLHAAAIAEYKTYRKTEVTLKQMLIKAVPLTYIEEMQDHQFGFARSTTLELLEHLDTNYGRVNFDDLAKNLENMHAPWSGDTPIETLWAQITHAKAYAAAHDPITDKAMIMSALTNLTNSGLFGTDLKSWDNTEAATQTWINLKQHFNKANHHRLKTTTISNAGYSATLKQQPDEINKENTKRPSKNNLDNWKYCWSHGLNRSHAGNKCRYPAEGHILTAPSTTCKKATQIYVCVSKDLTHQPQQ
jgi:hypothetical protein